MAGFRGEPNPKSNSVHSSLVLLKFFVGVSSSFDVKVLLTMVFDVVVVADAGDEDVAEEELRENNKVISIGLL